MKLYRICCAMIIVSLCLTSGVILAQEDPIKPPTLPLVPCTDKKVDDGHLYACDMFATKPEDIVGVWTVYFNSMPAFIRYNVDGTWVMANTAARTDAATVAGYPSGTFRFDEGVFTSLATITAAPLPEGCTAGRYLLRVIKVGDQPVALNHTLVEDCFVPRRTDWAYTMLWVSGS